MRKAKTPGPAKPPVRSRRSPAVNPQANLQTRKLLQKHYRARHGVKEAPRTGIRHD